MTHPDVSQSAAEGLMLVEEAVEIRVLGRQGVKYPRDRADTGCLAPHGPSAIYAARVYHATSVETARQDRPAGRA